MTEMEPREAGMDSLLRRSMAAPVPALPTDFDQRLMRKLNQGPPKLDGRSRIMLTAYGLISVVTSAVVMRGQGLDWSVTAMMIGVPLILVAMRTAPRTWRQAP